MNVIINTEYSSFHADMSPSEFENLLKIMARAKQIERAYAEGSDTKTTYVLNNNGTPPIGMGGHLNIFATIHAPAMPEGPNDI